VGVIATLVVTDIVLVIAAFLLGVFTLVEVAKRSDSNPNQE